MTKTSESQTADSRLQKVNEIGLRFLSLETEKLQNFYIYPEGGQVLVWAQINDKEAMQYMKPHEAMAFAKAFERCAIQALKDGS